jgi:hypothetical protein
MTIIYYVGLRVSPHSQQNLQKKYNIASNLHSTIIYSRTWFPYKPKLPSGLIIDPPFTVDYFENIAVLRFSNELLTERHNELKKLGASWDYNDFKAHISLGPITRVSSPEFSISFSDEYYMTWEEK